MLILLMVFKDHQTWRLPDPLPCGSGEASQLREFHFRVLVKIIMGMQKSHTNFHKKPRFVNG
jgi:hypothetical protein